MIFFDTPSTYFELDFEDGELDGDEEGEPFRLRGHSKDARDDLPQVVIGTDSAGETPFLGNPSLGHPWNPRDGRLGLRSRQGTPAGRARKRPPECSAVATHRRTCPRRRR